MDGNNPMVLTASLFGLSTVQALVVLFVLLPIAAGVIIVPLVSWRISSSGPPPLRTSEILANGIPVTAQIVAVKTLGSIIEVRPMVRFVLRVQPNPDGEPFELEVVQSLPRSVIGGFRSGDLVHARLSADLSAGAVVWQDTA